VTLVLRWRAPGRRIATRWRGPAGLAEAIGRDPSYPAAAVVGPPGSEGTATFPLLALAADATAPAPAGGAGSAAWSTAINQPMFWDGSAWRTIAHFGSLSATPPPVNTAPPTISGVARVGETLAATAGAWTSSPFFFAYQWRADGNDIAGATSASFALTGLALGTVVTVAVIAVNSAGSSDEAISEGTSAVAPSGPDLFSLDFSAGALPAEATFARASSGSYFDNTGTLQTAATNAARFDHDPVSLTPRGLLIEPAATNLLTYSEQLDNETGWNRTGVNFTADAIAAPDGASSADKMAENTGTSNHGIWREVGMAAGRHTLSVWLKAGERNFGGICLGEPGGARYSVLIDLTDGSFVASEYVGTPTGTGYAVEAAGGGWYRLSVTLTSTGSGNGVVAIMLNDDETPSWSGGVTIYAGDGGSGIHGFGAQLEAGDAPTSYVATAGSTVSRAADALSFTVPDGISSLRYTFDDDSTQDLGVSPGTHAVPTNLDRVRIKRVEGS
jgi:hypothetical protein